MSTLRAACRRAHVDGELRGLGESRGVLLDRRRETGARVDGGAEAEDRLAHVDVDRPRGGRELGQLGPRLGHAIRFEEPLDGLRLRVDVAEHLRQPVVHLAGDPGALLVDGELAKPLLEPGVLDRDRRLAGERPERFEIVGAIAPGAARADDQAPERHAAALQRDLEPGCAGRLVDRRHIATARWPGRPGRRSRHPRGASAPSASSRFLA